MITNNFMPGKSVSRRIGGLFATAVLALLGEVSSASTVLNEQDIIAGLGAKSYSFEVLSAADHVNVTLQDISVAPLQHFDNIGMVVYAVTGNGYVLKKYAPQPGSFDFAADPGEYMATVFGRGAGVSDMGMYSVFMSMVPEPSEWLMMVSGLLIVGCLVRVRRRNVAMPAAALCS